MISPSQRPLPDNTKHSQHTNIQALGGIRTHDRSRRAAVDLRLRPRGHWDRHLLIYLIYNYQTYVFKYSSYVFCLVFYVCFLFCVFYIFVSFGLLILLLYIAVCFLCFTSLSTTVNRWEPNYSKYISYHISYHIISYYISYCLYQQSDRSEKQLILSV